MCCIYFYCTHGCVDVRSARTEKTNIKYIEMRLTLASHLHRNRRPNEQHANKTKKNERKWTTTRQDVWRWKSSNLHIKSYEIILDDSFPSISSRCCIFPWANSYFFFWFAFFLIHRRRRRLFSNIITRHFMDHTHNRTSYLLYVWEPER